MFDQNSLNIAFIPRTLHDFQYSARFLHFSVCITLGAGGLERGGTLQVMSQKLHEIGGISSTASAIGPQLSLDIRQPPSLCGLSCFSFLET
jgi:hypothetical protein